MPIIKIQPLSDVKLHVAVQEPHAVPILNHRKRALAPQYYTVNMVGELVQPYIRTENADALFFAATANVALSIHLELLILDSNGNPTPPTYPMVQGLPIDAASDWATTTMSIPPGFTAVGIRIADIKDDGVLLVLSSLAYVS